MFTLQQLRETKASLEKELEVVGKKLGLAFEITKPKYGEVMVFTLTAKKPNKDGTAPPTEHEAQFIRFATAFGLKPTDLGRKVTLGGVTFEIAGLNTRAHKTPIIGKKVSNGKLYRLGISEVQNGLKGGS